ncbi:peptidase [Flavobacterium album]|uniref:Peptidase n=1 Tax=Flavobacterium album TaxID=2175091 RepID=A0A2S1QTK0_9FLAO|nr:murein L,D-transpeptidase catalytic domain family protein [Flavobacterium album]AWH83732.1 peptidase [Flavobacterium album]
MTRFISILFFGLISCINATETEPAKDYTSKHTEALAYCKKQKFNEDYYFLIDMSVHSGRNRFYVYDFKQKKITDSNLVTHGSCDMLADNDEKYDKVKFSNVDGSHCTSSGKYKIGKRDYSSWGIKIKYWLKGLEKTNSNAEARVVVLHSWTAVPDTEVYPHYAPLSWGCPAVSDNFMKKLDAKLQKTEKPVLLWIID